MSEVGVSAPSLRSWSFTHPSQIPHVLLKSCFPVGMCGRRVNLIQCNLGCGFFFSALTLCLLTAGQGRMAGNALTAEMITGRFCVALIPALRKPGLSHVSALNSRVLSVCERSELCGLGQALGKAELVSLAVIAQCRN